jgi:phospholipid-binding lipoprotein MlaA
MRGAERRFRGSIACGLAALLSACAGVPRDASLPIDDPNEQFNRRILGVNQAVLDPVANVVKAATPPPALDRFRDLNSNIEEPRIFANDILQGRIGAAGVTLGRFVFNSTFGLGGLFDVATPGGLKKQSGDFGQTLFVWGVPAGPFVERPYFGPGTMRDSFGEYVDLAGDPVGWALGLAFGWPAVAGVAGLDAEVHLAEWKEAENASIDFYSFLRSAYYQERRETLREALGLPPLVVSPVTAGSSQ